MRIFPIFSRAGAFLTIFCWKTMQILQNKCFNKIRAIHSYSMYWYSPLQLALVHGMETLPGSTAQPCTHGWKHTSNWFKISPPEWDVKLSFLVLATVFKAASVTHYTKSDLHVELMLNINAVDACRFMSRNQTLFLISILLHVTAVVPENIPYFVFLF